MRLYAFGDAGAPPPQNRAPIARATDITGQPKTMYPNTEYSVTAKYFDPDGRADLRHCQLRLKHPTKPLTMMWYEDTKTWTASAGEEGANYLTITNVTHTAITEGGVEGYRLTWRFKIDSKWPEVANAIDFGVYATDGSELTSGWEYDNTKASFFQSVGYVTGKVTNAYTGKGVAGATVEATGPTTASTTTDSSGNYRLPLPPGRYSVTASATGYRSQTKTGITVTAGQTTTVDLALAPTIADHDWVTVTKDGACIYRDQNGVPSSVTCKCLPQGWVLKRLWKEGKPVEGTPDGIRWYNNVEDVTDGTKGWIERGDVATGGDSSRVRIVLRGVPDDPQIPQDFRFTKDLQRDNEGDEVKYLQLILKAEVGNPTYPSETPATGFFGATTEVALKALQALHQNEQSNLTVTGILDEATRTLLNAWLESGRYELTTTRATFVRQTVHSLVQTPPSWVQTKFEKFHTFLSAPAPMTTSDIMWIILGMALQETHTQRLDNEYVSGDWGRGIMQITTETYVGAGSGVKGQDCSGGQHACLSRTNPKACRTYYTNTPQGIEANIRDAFFALSNKYQQFAQTCTEEMRNKLKAALKNAGYDENLVSCEEYWFLRAVWGYNGNDCSRPCLGYCYLYCVARRLSELTVFGDEAPPANSEWVQTWSQKLTAVANLTKTGFVLRSPGELSVRDSAGRITGVRDGLLYAEIPFSWYDPDEKYLGIDLSSDSYCWQVVGTGTGNYGVTAVLTANGTTVTFTATGIRTSPGAVHQYIFDWDALARGAKGVTVRIDQDGDGVFERTIHAGSELRGDDIGTIPPGSALNHGPNPVPATGCTFWFSLPDGTRSAKLMIYNVVGQMMAEIPLDPASTRYPTTGRWNPVDRNGVPLANGPYVYVLIADGRVIGQGKMVIQR